MEKLKVFTIIAVMIFSSTAMAGTLLEDADWEEEQRQIREFKATHPEEIIAEDANERDLNVSNDGYKERYSDDRDYEPEGYAGHWTSWSLWLVHKETSEGKYPNYRYYEVNNQLYFEFYDEEGNKSTYSIGR